MRHNLFFLIALVFQSAICTAQSFFGVNGLGHLEILNDSICTVRFITDHDVWGFSLERLTDTCSFIKSGDTIFISTPKKQRFELAENCYCDTTGKLPIIFYVFSRESGKDNYQLCYEGICYACKNHLIDFTNYSNFHNGDIVVVRYFTDYERFKWIYGKGEFILRYIWNDGCCLDNFPLLVKGNKLIPIDKEKNEQCWIENGFYFPTMKKSSKKKFFDVIVKWSLGLRDLPNPYPENTFGKISISIDGYINTKGPLL